MNQVIQGIKKYYKTLIVALLIIAVIIILLSRNNSPSAYEEEKAQRRDILTYNSFVGNVESSSEYELIPKASSTVTSLYISEGDAVYEGQIIAELDHSTVDYNIRLKEASLSQSNTQNSYNVKDAEKTYNDFKETLDAGKNTSLMNAQSQKDSAKQAYENAKTAYENAVKDSESNASVVSAKEQMNKVKEILDQLNSSMKKENAKTVLDESENDLSTAQSQYDNAVNIALEKLKQECEETGDMSPYEAALNDYSLLTDTNVIAARQYLDSCQNAYDQASTEYQNVLDEYAAAEANYESAKQNYESVLSAQNSQLDTLKSQMESAKTSYDNAISNYEAVVMQVNQQLQTYANNLEKARANSNTYSSQLELQHLKDSLADYTLKAPVSGTVTSLNIKQGGLVNTSQTAVVISNLNTMKITIKIDEYSILKVKEGSFVTIYIDSINKTYNGTITRIADTATVEGGVSYFTAEVKFVADDDVRSGMSVEVRLITADEKNVLSVSNNAIFYDSENKSYVILTGSSGKEEKRYVELGKTDGSYVQVLDGISENDVVILPSLNSFTNPFEETNPRN